MKRTNAALLALLALLAFAAAGCGGSGNAPATQDASAEAHDHAAGEDGHAHDAAAPAADGATADAADAPQLVKLTDQRTVWSCPTCGMNFDRAGKCSMGCADLVEMNVAYVCPVNGRDVGKAGKCPDCPQDVKVQKTAVAMATPPAGGGK